MKEKNSRDIMLGIIQQGADELQDVYDRIKEGLEVENIWRMLADMKGQMDSIVEKTKKRFREEYHSLRDSIQERDSIHSLDELYKNLSDIVYDARIDMDKIIEEHRMKEHHSMEEYRSRELGKMLRDILVSTKEKIKHSFDRYYPSK
jgi:hypothetical protein